MGTLTQLSLLQNILSNCCLLAEKLKRLIFHKQFTEIKLFIFKNIFKKYFVVIYLFAFFQLSPRVELSGKVKLETWFSSGEQKGQQRGKNLSLSGTNEIFPIT